MKGGECRLFEAPKIAIAGQRQEDQDWIDGNVEAGIGGCGWKRPAPRPDEWKTAHSCTIQTRQTKKKRPGIIHRIKAKLSPAPKPPLPPAAPLETIPQPPPPPPPRDPVDELLHPGGK